MPLQQFNVLVDDFALPLEERRSAVRVLWKKLEDDSIDSMMQEVMVKVAVVGRPRVRFYDISPSNIPLASNEIPATLPAPLNPLLTLDEALSNPQERIIHFYATFTPVQPQAAQTLNLGHPRQISLYPLDRTTILRQNLVEYLFSVASEHKLFLVKGTPGSGKSTLAYQLFNHILRTAPADRVSMTKLWQKQGTVEESFIKSRYLGDIVQDPTCLTRGDGVRHWILMDEAQESYSDTVLWNTWLKELPERFIFVLFAYRGIQNTAGTSVPEGNPNALLPHMQMLLRPTENGFTFMRDTHIPGLYFTLAEFQELVLKRRHTNLPTLDQELSDWVYHASAGHIGAIESIFLCITYVAKRRRSSSLTYDDFFVHFEGVDAALADCSRGLPFARGIPKPHILQHPDNLEAIQFLKELLVSGVLVFRSLELPVGARVAHKRGWVTLDKVQQSFVVEFPSPFHRSRVSFLLVGDTDPSAEIEAMTLEQAERHAAGSQGKPSVPEAHWHNEIYRGAWQVTGGRGLWMSPEFDSATKSGRIGFFITGSKRWGMEVLHEGDRIDEHLDRFLPGGAYHDWVAKGIMKQYVVLDFRTQSEPREKMPSTFPYFGGYRFLTPS
ncbi:hypothetical protein GGX14DRAFT_448073 [Mycena pura]|uniref:Uncharacterized protein n=1 Tax=Mycena pura TaxID=153505 RepID=A0AAD6YBQ9_9AGAR|nr:hypothetical protein GGX14DRAFT_448073 [Mycena pura]